MAQTLKALRKHRKYTLKELAELVGCSPKTLTLYETNPPAAVNRKITDNLARVLEVTPDYILKLLGSSAADPPKAQAGPPKAGKRSGKQSHPKTERAVRKRTSRGSRKFSFPQRVLLGMLVNNEIGKLREFILASERSAAEDGLLKQAVSDTYAEIQNLQELLRLLTAD